MTITDVLLKESTDTTLIEAEKENLKCVKSYLHTHDYVVYWYTFTGYQLRITVKNDNLLAHKLLRIDSVGKLLAGTPDLITIINTDTGKASSMGS